MKLLKWLLAVAAVLALLALALFKTAPGQDFLLDRVLAARGQQATAGPPPIYDGLEVFVCGAASPLGSGPEWAQACIAIVAGEDIYLVDVGTGAPRNVAAGLPRARVRGVFLTHFHSDHIGGLADVNLNTWIGGRPQALAVYGPDGVQTVVDGLNRAYQLDRGYRTAHHGADLLPPSTGAMTAWTIDLEGQSEKVVPTRTAGLSVTAFAVDHAPISPALGYRFDYQGRSVVVSGDTNAVATTERAADGVDLLFHDALSEYLVKRLAAVAGPRGSRILTDVLDYHAHTEDVVALAERAGVRQLVFYHLVPVPQVSVMADVFRRGVPDEVILARDRMRFRLPANSDEIIGP